MSGVLPGEVEEYEDTDLSPYWPAPRLLTDYKREERAVEVMAARLQPVAQVGPPRSPRGLYWVYGAVAAVFALAAVLRGCA